MTGTPPKTREQLAREVLESFAGITDAISSDTAIRAIIAAEDAERERGSELEAAARHYANHYLVDEAADVECCISEAQHLDAIALFDALERAAIRNPEGGS